MNNCLINYSLTSLTTSLLHLLVDEAAATASTAETTAVLQLLLHATIARLRRDVQRRRIVVVDGRDVGAATEQGLQVGRWKGVASR